jgi:hypothetical protein
MPNTNKLNRSARDQRIIDALGEYFTSTATITLGKKVYKVKDLQQQFQAEVDAAKVTQSAKTAYQQAAKAEAKVSTQITPLYKLLRGAIVSQFGPTSDEVAGFGFTPKEPQTDVATKVLAIEKREATRLARGTKGSKQRQAIKGNVPATVSAATSPAAPKPATTG